MLSFLTNEAMIGMIGTGTGFLFRQIAESRRQKHEEMIAALDRRERSMDAAAERGGVGGTVMRRMIYGLVAVIFLSVVAAGFMDVPVVVEQPVTRGWWLWKRTFTEFITINGVLFPPEIRQAFIYLMTFYCGQGVK